MKQQQSQMQGAAPGSAELDIEATAIRNFEMKNVRGDRAWSRDRMDPRRPALVLSERERLEFIEQARHELERVASGTAHPRRLQ